MGVKCKGVTTRDREDGWRLKGERQKGGIGRLQGEE